MAFFECFKKGTVTILEDESDNLDEGTTLLVGDSLLSSEVSEVDNSLHIPSWSQEVFCQLSSFKKSKSTSRDLHSIVLQLKFSHHTETDSLRAFELLSDRIHNGAVNWSSVLLNAGESTFTEYYWEWLEDMLSRNTRFLRALVCITLCLPYYLGMIHMLQSFEPLASTGVLQQILFIHCKEKCPFPFGISMKSAVFQL
ncbi:hypothetical protein L3X38_011415 [Prunus dulcis]|uniref:Uncharacterized protein n=1 Tax=Prunus dulcis TaxID=3755 RepID=A0AAD4ZF42_PRUDU|nr:hypothetical protein L3X38_011415 [Prunus dulcis]